jgi:hypothetical protein
MSHHASRPIPAKRIFASLTQAHYPTRESDGPGYVGTMLDMRQLRIKEARDSAYRWFAFARAARLRGDWCTWHICFAQGSAHRKSLAGLLRSGGRVDWRGQPINN